MTDDEPDPVSEAEAFAYLRPESFVRIEGLDDGPTDWHVNKNFMVSHGEDSLQGLLAQFAAGEVETESTVNRGIVLQKADASAEWLALVVTLEGADWKFRSAAHFPTLRDGPEDVDTDNLAVTATAETQNKLPNDD